MMAATSTHTEIGVPGYRALQAYQLEAEKLPPHGYKWRSCQIRLSTAAVKRFARAGVIQKVGKGNPKKNRAIWMTTPGVYEWVQDTIAGADRTPCQNATGIRNLGDGEYTCLDEDCDCRMDRETVEEVFG